MRFKFHVPAITLLILSLTLPGSAPRKTRAATQDKKSGSPVAGIFRVTLNGFKVNHESDDDILEGDGKRDEVYLRADVWVLKRDGSVPYRGSPRTLLMGDINRQTYPPRIQAGSASDKGGLRTNDKWPSNEPWRRVTDPLPDRLPMLLWEGSLVQGENMVVIVPTVWEWDSSNPSDSEIYWDSSDGVISLFEAIRNTYRYVIEKQLSDFLFSPGAINFASTAGTRPIGIRPIQARGDPSRFLPKVLTLTYDAALTAARSTPSNTGSGVIALNYADQRDHGDYTLFVQIEQVH